MQRFRRAPSGLSRKVSRGKFFVEILTSQAISRLASVFVVYVRTLLTGIFFRYKTNG